MICLYIYLVSWGICACAVGFVLFTSGGDKYVYCTYSVVMTIKQVAKFILYKTIQQAKLIFILYIQQVRTALCLCYLCARNSNGNDYNISDKL